MRFPAYATLTLFLLSSPTLAANVPNVVGLDGAAASSAIQHEQLTPRLVSEGQLSLQAIGSVASQNPAGGKNIPAHSVVEYTLSAGVWVRNFVGSDVSAVQSEMPNTGVKFDLVDAKVPGMAKGIVAAQTPRSEQLIDATKTTVQFQVAVGPWIAVPDDLVGKTTGAVRKELSDLQLAVATMPPDTPDFGILPPGGNKNGKQMCLQTPWHTEVVSIDPAPGTLLFPNATVTVQTKRVMDHDQAIKEPCYCEKNGLTCTLE